MVFDSSIFQPPKTLIELLDATDEHVARFRDELPKDELSQFAKRFGLLTEESVKNARSVIATGMAAYIGTDTCRFIDESCLLFESDQRLREILAKQLGDLVQFHISNLYKQIPIDSEMITAPDESPRLITGHGDSVVEVGWHRISQMLDWGMIPSVSDKISAKFIQTLGVKHGLNRLQWHMGSMRNIASSSAFSELREKMDVASWVSHGSGLPLELLVRDILNLEDDVYCRLAPLHEDVLEATDLRVRIREVKRRKGVRIQVSWVVSGSLKVS